MSDNGIETIRLPSGASLKCKDLDNKRKVCAVDDEVVVLNNSKLSSYRVDPALGDPRGIVIDGKGYEEYYEGLLKNKGDTEKLKKMKRMKKEMKSQL